MPTPWAQADSLPQRIALTLAACALVVLLPFGPNRLWLAAVVLVVQAVTTALIRSRRPEPIDELGMYLVVEHSLIALAAIVAPAGYVAVNMVSIASLGVNSPYQPPRWQRPTTALALGALIVPVLLGGVEAGAMVIGAGLLMIAHITFNRCGSLVDAEAAADAARRDASCDSLTGLANRRVLRSSLVDIEQSGERASLVLLDIDNFKEMNDTLGHDFGDQVLRAVAERLSAIDAHVQVVRLGGDEFAALVSGGPEQMDDFVERLGCTLAESMMIGDVPVTLRASVGMAHTDCVAADQLLRSADIAMYRSKRSGSGPVWYRPEDNPHSERRMTLLQDLPAAVENGEVRPWFQPQVNIRTGTVVGGEALARWHHPTFGVIGAGELLSQIELAGLQPELTESMLRQSIRAASEWPDHVALSVNVTLCCIMTPRFVDHLVYLLDAEGFEAHRLTLEVVETAQSITVDDLPQAVAAVRALGVSVSLDDFGQASSSLARLDVIDADELKIDRWFISRMIEHRRDRAIVDSIVDLARRLDMRVMAEGVETADEAQAVADAGIDVAQGYFYARPSERLVIADHPTTLPTLVASVANYQ